MGWVNSIANKYEERQLNINMLSCQSVTYKGGPYIKIGRWIGWKIVHFLDNISCVFWSSMLCYLSVTVRISRSQNSYFQWFLDSEKTTINATSLLH